MVINLSESKNVVKRDKKPEEDYGAKVKLIIDMYVLVRKYK